MLTSFCLGLYRLIPFPGAGGSVANPGFTTQGPSKPGVSPPKILTGGTNPGCRQPESDIVKERGQTPSKDAQEVRPSTPAEGKAIVSGADWYEVPAELVMRWRALMRDYAEVQEELARIVGIMRSLDVTDIS
jgi:hypothetical protein